MDLSIIEHFIPDIARFLNLEPATVIFLIGVICTIANVLSRVIPDDAVGFWGVVRKVSSILGVYVSNRISKGVSTNDVVKSVVEAAPEILEPQPDAPAPVPAFPGFKKVNEEINDA